MKNLYYFPKKKYICWLAGYCKMDMSEIPAEIIQDLQNNVRHFSEMVGVDENDIGTFHIRRGSMHVGKRVFYAKIDKADVPDGAKIVEGMEMDDFFTQS